MKFIYLQPAGEVRKEILHYLCAGLEEIYSYSCRIAEPVKVPEDTYSAIRGQYSVEAIVDKLSKKMPEDAKKLLGVVDVDLFVPGLNFVFGVAIGSAAVISLTRLRPEFYGEKGNEALFKERALKEAVHELGHTFGLSHCPDIKCVMHFSNFLGDTDIKGTGFCGKCAARMRMSNP